MREPEDDADAWLTGVRNGCAEGKRRRKMQMTR
jgi:hypothetical protein